jgi:hypothetical protein
MATVRFSACTRYRHILTALTIPQVASPLRMDALLRVTRQLSKLDPNRLIANINYITRGDPRAPSAWMSLIYDLRELEDVFDNLTHAGHDVRAAYQDFDDLRRWVYATASTMSHPTPHSPRSTHSVSRSTHFVPAQSPSQRSPVTTSTRPEHARPRVSPTTPTSPKRHHHSPKGHIVAPTPTRISPSPKARAHVRFAPTAIVYTIPRDDHPTLPPTERPSCVPRTPRQSHAKR